MPTLLLCLCFSNQLQDLQGDTDGSTYLYDAQLCLFATSWTVAHQAPLSIGILLAKIVEWVATLSSRGSSQPRDQTQVSYIAGGFFTSWAIRETLYKVTKW